MTSTPSKKTTCNCCGEQFSSRNRYFKHQRDNTCICGFHSNSAHFDTHKQQCTKDKTLEKSTVLETPVVETRSLPPTENTIVNDNLSNLNSKSSLLEIIGAYNNLISQLTNLYVDHDHWCPYGCNKGISEDDIDMILYESKKNLLGKLNLPVSND